MCCTPNKQGHYWEWWKILSEFEKYAERPYKKKDSKQKVNYMLQNAANKILQEDLDKR